MLNPVAMVGWSGSGAIRDLEGTVARVLSVPVAKVERSDGSLLIDAKDPVEVALRVGLMPGVEWVGAGYRFEGMEGYVKMIETLAKRHLVRSRRFRIIARAEASGLTGGDLVLAGNSAILSAVKGARVEERVPQVRFRVSSEGGGGACGVELRAGPGGTPTKGGWAACLVSGGERSAATSWMAALSGYSIRLVHATSDDLSIRQVARLYSELSNRMDATRLELAVLEGGGTPFDRVGAWLTRNAGTAFSGWRPTLGAGAAALARKFPGLAHPLVLIQDDAVASTYASLGLGRPSNETVEGGFAAGVLRAKSAYFEIRFGGVRADLNAVIDFVRTARRRR